MEDKKRVTILVTIALLLAITAIALNVLDSNQEVPTSSPRIPQSSPTGAVIGIDIQAPTLEDKSTGENA